MSITLGIGTIITRYNVFKFKDILASLLGSFIEKDKKGLTDNYTQEYKDREFMNLC